MNRVRSSLLIGVFTVAAPQMAGAQAVPGGAASEKEAEAARDAGTPASEIVVTAQRRVQRLQDVPISVNVVSGDSLRNQNLSTARDITQRIPNVQITTGQSSELLNIRGVGSGSNPGFEQSVATFVDGVNRPRTRLIRAATFDIDQLEVLKGPQTTFFGANAIAGALNVTTRKPSHSLSYDATALYGMNNEYLAEVGVGGPVSDTLAARIAVRARGMDDYIDNASAPNRGKLREYTGRISLRWEPTSNFRSDLRIDGDRLRDTSAYDAELVNCPTDPKYNIAFNVTCTNATLLSGGNPDGKLDYHSNIVPGFSRNNFYEAAWTNTLDLTSVNITSTTAYSYTYNKLMQNLLPNGETGPNQLGTFPIRGRDRYKQFSQELRLQSPSGGTIEYLAGGYFERGRLYAGADAEFLFAPFGSFLPPEVNPAGYDATSRITGWNYLNQTATTWAGFGAVTVRPISKMRLNGALRYASVHKETSRHFEIGASPATPAAATGLDPFNPSSAYEPAPLITQQVLATILGGNFNQFLKPTRTDAKLTGSASIQYDVTPNVMLYGSYTNGFKAGGYGAFIELEEFGPETVNAFEVGTKGSLLDKRLTFSFAAFRSNYKNLQEGTIVFLPSGATVTLTRNVASSVSQGFEGSVDLRVTSRLRLAVDAAYLDSHYKSYPDGACRAFEQAQDPTCSQNLSGRTRPYSPKFSGNVSADYRWEIGNLTFDGNANLNFTSKFYQQFNLDSLYVQSGFAKLDLRLGVRRQGSDVELAIVGKNVTDKLTASFRGGAPGSAGSVIAFPDRGRSVAVQLTVRH